MHHLIAIQACIAKALRRDGASTDIEKLEWQAKSSCPAAHRLAPSRRSALLCLCALLSGAPVASQTVSPTAPTKAAVPAPVMLANVYSPRMPLADYWVSEKYDGVRGYWDGRQLLTRGGQKVVAPPWFTADWPSTPMDGELWAGRGQFGKASATVRQQMPDEQAWRSIRFMVFDLPSESTPFSQRISTLNATVSRIGQPWVQAVAQSRVANHAALERLMRQVVRDGGEGLMLHRGASLYQAVRSDDLLKYKPYEDAEARVISHVAGRGKYAGLLGALVVETAGADGQPGRRFKLGSGFSDVQRQTPPPVGSWVTYRYRGINDSGIPRFASFMRVREDMPAAAR